MDRFPEEIVPVNVWAKTLTKLIAEKCKKKLGKSERLKNLK